MPTFSDLILREDDDQKLANLRPLVPVDEDEQEVIDRLVEAWCDPQTGGPLERMDWFGDEVPDHPAVLAGVDLINANTREPIDLGQLLRAVIERLEAGPPTTPKPDPAIILIGCRIHTCNAAGLTVPANLKALGCLFNENTDFSDAAFSGENTDFRYAAFSGKNTDFSDAAFSGENTYFSRAAFSGKNTDFSHAAFSGKNTDFSDAAFSGENTYFSRAAFSGKNTDF
ncbi:MAG: hypothetical protein AAGH88_10065, partial [Planctomycetota bacterium]